MTIHVKTPRSVAASVWRALVTQLRRARGWLFAGLLMASLLALATSLFQLYRLNQQNHIIASLQAGNDVHVEANAPGEVQLARANFLISRDRFDDAQTVIDAAKPSVSPRVMSRMLYNQANSHVRRAFAAIEASQPDGAIPLTKLAKDAYREALRLDPQAWNAKHNYDVATRLMRDFPGYEQDGEEVPPEAEVKLWTDLPGVPQGAP